MIGPTVLDDLLPDEGILPYPRGEPPSTGGDELALETTAETPRTNTEITASRVEGNSVIVVDVLVVEVVLLDVAVVDVLEVVDVEMPVLLCVLVAEVVD